MTGNDRQEIVHEAIGRKRGWAVVSLILGWSLLTALQYVVEWAPPLIEAPAPEDFQTASAQEKLRTIFGPFGPHPSNSDAIRTIQDKLQAALETMGFSVSVQETSALPRQFLPDNRPAAIPLNNLIVVQEGSAEDAHENTVLVVAHYDSTPFGPGISDDAVGIAVCLQVAEQLRQQLPIRNRVIFLFTDGEEKGLLGAQKFVEEHPLARDIRVVVNLEARGTSGRSLMFQTGSPNRWLVELMARTLRRPAASSLFVEIYKRLPNDTDFTVFLKDDRQGFNFAYIGDAGNYHTPHDDLEHLSMRSLAHHGRNVWELVKELANRPLDKSPHGDAVFFDLWGRWLIWWPVEWTLGLALVGLVSASWACWRNVFSPESGMRACCHALGHWFCVSLAALLVTTALVYGMSYEKLWTIRFPEAGFALAGGLWCASLALMVLVSQRFSVDPAAQLGMVVLIWNLMSVVVAQFAVGASYLFLVPALVGAGVLWLMPRRSRESWAPWLAVGFSLGVASLWLTIELLFFAALGNRSFWLIAPKVVWVGGSWLPVLAATPKSHLRVLAAGFGVAGVVLLALGVYSNRIAG